MERLDHIKSEKKRIARAAQEAERRRREMEITLQSSHTEKFFKLISKEVQFHEQVPKANAFHTDLPLSSSPDLRGDIPIVYCQG